MLEWEESFEPHILERGRNYARRGAVAQISKKGDMIEAVVAGSEYYKVSLHYDGHNIRDCYCSCPYAAGSSYCKHMAAVLYEVDARAENEKKPADSSAENEQNPAGSSYNCFDGSDAKSVEELIAEADRDQLARILLDLAESDEKIESHIRAALAGLSPATNISELESAIDSIFSAHSGRGNFIDYYGASDFADNLILYLDNTTARMFDEGDYYSAFEISKYAYVKLGNYDIDDDGQISMISDCCYKIWQTVVNNCSAYEKAQIREWFTEHSEDGTVVDYMENMLQEFLKYELATREELQQIMSHLDELIEQSRGSNKCKSVFSVFYGYNIEAIELRMILMRRIGAKEAEIDDFRRQYICFQSVRKYFIEKAREEGDIEEEIRLLNESRILDADSKYLVHLYTARLIELYHDRNDFASEKKERKKDFLLNIHASIDDFKAYRDMCSKEEWNEERKSLISSRTDTGMRCELLAEEKLFPELFETISKQKEKRNLFNKYGYLLAEDYSEPILQEYRNYVSVVADYARNRSSYDELTRYLKRMEQYTGGCELVRTLCREWINNYPSRKVMIQELEKILLPLESKGRSK